jgi:hypothetical protein
MRLLLLPLAGAAALILSGCRFKAASDSDALDAETDILASAMIRRLDRGCGAGGCHDSASGVLASPYLMEVARATATVHSCLLLNVCYADDITQGNARNCLDRCVRADAPDFRPGIFNATLRPGGILNQLAQKAGVPVPQLTMMPPGNSLDATNIAVPISRFKELADWLTSEAEDRSFREIVDLRGQP